MTNLVILTGKVFHLKEIGKTGGTAKFSIGVYKRKAGAREGDKDAFDVKYFECIAFKKVGAAVIAANPQRVTVIGELDLNEYKPDGGDKTITKVQVICNKILVEVGAEDRPRGDGSEFSNYGF